MCFMNCPYENWKGECTVKGRNGQKFYPDDAYCTKELYGELYNEEDNFHHQEKKEED